MAGGKKIGWFTILYKSSNRKSVSAMAVFTLKKDMTVDDAIKIRNLFYTKNFIFVWGVYFDYKFSNL